MIDPNSKVRESLIATINECLTANTLTANVYDAMASAEKEADSIGVGTEGEATEEPVGSGNWWIMAKVEVKSIAAVDTDATDPKADADILKDAVFAWLERPDLADELTAAISDFTCFGFGAEKSFQHDREGDSWINTWKRKVYCCAGSMT